MREYQLTPLQEAILFTLKQAGKSITCREIILFIEKQEGFVKANARLNAVSNPLGTVQGQMPLLRKNFNCNIESGRGGYKLIEEQP